MRIILEETDKKKSFFMIFSSRAIFIQGNQNLSPHYSAYTGAGLLMLASQLMLWYPLVQHTPSLSASSLPDKMVALSQNIDAFFGRVYHAKRYPFE